MQGDLPFGAVMKSAFEAGLRMWAVFPDDSYSDIGVPDHLVEAISAVVERDLSLVDCIYGFSSMSSRGLAPISQLRQRSGCY